MHRILIVTNDHKPLAAFAESLEQSRDVQLAWVENGREAIADVMKHPPLGVVIDENLLDMPGLELVRRLLPINALINTVVLSELSDEAFHEAAEGLGIMARLPPQPTAADAGSIQSRLKRLAAAMPAPPRA
jgi:DNA-binding response OmpR family regulator